MPVRRSTTGDIEALLDGDGLKLLLTLSGSQSFQEAASTLRVSQAAISQQVRRLERIAGKALFRRSRRGLETTHEGEAVVAYARAVSELASGLRRQLGQVSKTEKICIGMSEDFCRTSLPTILDLFMRQYVHIDFRVVSGTYKTITDALESKAVDLAIMRKYGSYPNTTLLWKDRLLWNGRRNYALPVSDPVPLVVPIAPNPAREVLIETLRSVGRTWRVRFEAVGLAGVEAALGAGIGVCAGPAQLHLIGAGPLREGHGLPPLPDVEFVMVGPDPSQSDTLLGAFAELLKRATLLSFRSGASTREQGEEGAGR